MTTMRMATAERRRESNYREPSAEKREDAFHPMTPNQYYDLIARRPIHDGETRLLFAVLEDAIRCYAAKMASQSASQQREFEEVRAWVNTPGDHYLFSFDSICAVFGIEPAGLRRQLNSMGVSDFPRRRIRTVGRRTPLSVPD